MRRSDSWQVWAEFKLDLFTKFIKKMKFCWILHFENRNEFLIIFFFWTSSGLNCSSDYLGWFAWYAFAVVRCGIYVKRDAFHRNKKIIIHASRNMQAKARPKWAHVCSSPDETDVRIPSEKYLFMPLQKLRGQNQFFPDIFSTLPTVKKRKERLNYRSAFQYKSDCDSSIDFLSFSSAINIQKTSISCLINANNVLRYTMFPIYDIHSHFPCDNNEHQPLANSSNTYIENVIIRSKEK